MSTKQLARSIPQSATFVFWFGPELFVAPASSRVLNSPQAEDRSVGDSKGEYAVHTANPGIRSSRGLTSGLPHFRTKCLRVPFCFQQLIKDLLVHIKEDVTTPIPITLHGSLLDFRHL